MPATHVIQSSFLSGVLDPRASARVDTDAYQQGLLEGINIVPVHLGGVRRRPGLIYRAILPNKLSRVSSVASATAPNGGTAANANDFDDATVVTTTNTVGTNNPFVVIQYDLGSPQDILFADVMNIQSDGGSSTEFEIQYSNDNSSWTTLGDPLQQVDTTERSYRREGPVSARYWRVVKPTGADMGSAHITLSGFNLWQESSTVSEGRLFSFEVSTEERYVVILTDRTATIVNADTGAFIMRVPSPYASDELADVDGVSNAETLIVVHKDYPVRFFLRESPTHFQTFVPEFLGTPQFDFADSDSPTPTTDVQVLTFSADWEVGDQFQISLDGAKSAAIAFAGDNQQTADNIAYEVQKMWSVRAFTGVTCSRTSSLEFTVNFADAAADAYGDITVSPINKNTGTAGTVSVNHSTKGTPRRESIWGPKRGYPSSVELFEGRLYFGGTRSRQQTLLGSAVNNILYLEQGEGQDDDAIQVTLNGRQLNAITGLFAGRSLLIFTTGGEFRYVKEQGVPVTPMDKPVNQTQYGSARIRPVGIDGATIYVQRNRNSIRDFRFDYTENAYNSLGVSSLAAHLIYDVRDLAAWNGSAVDEISLVFVVNGRNARWNPNADELTQIRKGIFPHGTVAVFNSRRESNVQAWTIWQTQGEFKAVATIQQEIFFLVKRTINGVDGLYLEQADREAYTDCAVKVTNGVATSVITGLDHLDGTECRVRADGFVLENIIPAAGAATIQRPSIDVEVGLNWTPTVTPMPLQTYGPTSSSNLLRRKRVTKVRAKVLNTLGLLVNDRPVADRYFDINNFDMPAEPFSGTLALEETTNWDETEDKLVRFTQVDPLPFELLGIDVQLEVST